MTMFMHRRSESTQSNTSTAALLTRVAKCALLVMVLTLLPLLATRADAASCSQGCKKAELACMLATKAADKGCRRGCQDTFDASDHGSDAHDAFHVCRDACHTSRDTNRDSCRTTLQTCGDACDANLICSATCGNSLSACALTVVGGTRSCLSGCSPTDGACIGGCGSPGSVALHKGFAALDDCYNNPNSGFATCMSGGCNAVCGNGTIEPGETCDDFNTAPNDGCSATCVIEDLDGDGIYDDGDNSGISGDAPCTGGNTANCDDNCVYQPDATQADVDGDGVGDLCDFNCNAASGALIEGGVYLNSVAPANILPGSEVTACNGSCCSHITADANGAYQFVNLVPGTYTVTAQSPGNVMPGSIGPFVVTGTQTFNNQNIVRNGPQPPPAGTTLTGSTNGGIPSVYPGNDQTLTTTGCVNGLSATWTVIHPDGSTVSGSMNEAPAGTGNYTAILPAIPQTFAFGGPNQITIDIVCPNPLDDTSILFDVYIDPSGFTRFLNGNPAVGATVTLSRSENPLGPFVTVPDGSAIMSPKNRTNPDVSDATGHFGWDVIAGYYKVHAEINGCVAESAVLTIPPAVTDLDLVFECPCVSGPAPSCRTAAKGKLTITDSDDDAADSFVWKWSRGQATTQAEFGAPLTATAYDVCVYANSTAPLAALSVPADPMAWETTGASGTKGFKYGDVDGLSSGVTKVMLVSSATDFARIQVKGKGLMLPHPTLGNLPVPITVQLQRSDSSLCFESTFDLNDVITNTAEKLNVRVQ